MGKKSKLVQKNIELSDIKALQPYSSHDGTIGYVKLSKIIKPYFKGNAELNIWIPRINKWDWDCNWDWDFSIHIDDIF